jgi:hypothetical protein
MFYLLPLNGASMTDFYNNLPFKKSKLKRLKILKIKHVNLLEMKIPIISELSFDLYVIYLVNRRAIGSKSRIIYYVADV